MPGSAPIASSSTAPQHPELEQRPQAGPLPRKRGEIGFDDEQHGASDARSSSPVAQLPERHPADRDAPPPASPAAAPSTSSDPASPNPPNPSSSMTQPAANADDASSTQSSTRKKIIQKLFGSHKVPSYAGLQLTTLLAFIAQCLFFSATITGWGLTIHIVTRNGRQESQDSDELSTDPSSGQEPAPAPVSSTSAIFIHVVFAIAVLAQLLFLERRLFRLRAERYVYLHPGAMLPSYRTRRGRFGAPGDAIAFSPWNRPPLPTYAAALAQSGHGTGDVEDHIIAAPPPPAYGNTRGSTLLLQGFMRNSLLANRTVSVHSEGSIAVVNHSSRNPEERPVSYASHDSQWETIQDAERARVLEETLARLETRTAARS